MTWLLLVTLGPVLWSKATTNKPSGHQESSDCFVADRTLAYVWQTAVVNMTFKVIEQSREETIDRGVTVMLFSLPVSFLTEMNRDGCVSNKADQLRKVK